MTTHPPTQRDDARQLVDQGLSNRAVAAQIGVSEATIRRWRGEWRRNDAPATRDDAPDAVLVPLDDELRRTLAVLAEAGYTPAAGLRMCAQFVAGTLARNWGNGVIPRGVIPLMRIEFKPLAPTPQTPPIRHRRDETLTP